MLLRQLEYLSARERHFGRAADACHVSQPARSAGIRRLAAPHGPPIMHLNGFVRGKGRFVRSDCVPTRERGTRRFPLVLTTGRILSPYNVGAQTRRTANVAWHPEDPLEIHPHDAEVRGITDGDLVTLSGRVGSTTRARSWPTGCRSGSAPPPSTTR